MFSSFRYYFRFALSVLHYSVLHYQVTLYCHRYTTRPCLILIVQSGHHGGRQESDHQERGAQRRGHLHLRGAQQHRPDQRQGAAGRELYV